MRACQGTTGDCQNDSMDAQRCTQIMGEAMHLFHDHQLQRRRCLLSRRICLRRQMQPPQRHLHHANAGLPFTCACTQAAQNSHTFQAQHSAQNSSTLNTRHISHMIEVPAPCACRYTALRRDCSAYVIKCCSTCKQQLDCSSKGNLYV